MSKERFVYLKWRLNEWSMWIWMGGIMQYHEINDEIHQNATNSQFGSCYFIYIYFRHISYFYIHSNDLFSSCKRRQIDPMILAKVSNIEITWYKWFIKQLYLHQFKNINIYKCSKYNNLMRMYVWCGSLSKQLFLKRHLLYSNNLLIWCQLLYFNTFYNLHAPRYFIFLSLCVSLAIWKE